MTYDVKNDNKDEECDGRRHDLSPKDCRLRVDELRLASLWDWSMCFRSLDVIVIVECHHAPTLLHIIVQVTP